MRLWRTLARHAARCGAPDGGGKIGRTRASDHQKGEWAEDFLAAFLETGEVTKARAVAGIGRTALYDHRDADSEFARRFKEIRDTWIDIAREGSENRWRNGAPKTLFLVANRDPETGDVTYDERTVHEHSFARERFWLERMRPEEFAPTASETGSAAEFAQRIHEALGQIEGSMDEDAPAEGEETADAEG